MKMKSVMLFVVAIGCGTVAMLGVQKVLSKDRGPKKEDTVKVLVATAEIHPGVPLDATNTAFKAMAKASLPEGVVTSAEQYEKKTLRVRAYPGDLILEAKLGDGLGIAGDIPEGMRVVTISVDATKTHSGLMLPGNRVDVLATYRARKAGSSNSSQTVQRTRMVLENIQVFATDNRRDAGGKEAGDNTAKNVSLLVSPEQANLLMLAESKGKLHLTLRGDRDAITGKPLTVDDDDFDGAAVGIGEPEGDGAEEAPVVKKENSDLRSYLENAEPAADVKPVVVEAPAAPKWKVSIYAGGEVKVHEVDLPPEPVTEAAPKSEPAGEPKETSATGEKIKSLVIKFFAGV